MKGFATFAFTFNVENFQSILGICAIIFIAMLTIGMVFAKLYKKSSKEVSFVRTGWGGQKVIMDGGAIVLPVLHDMINVNMNTLRLEVSRNNEQALITKDRMRVDVTAEFYVRVKPNKEAIAHAAQTLGKRTLDPRELKELVEGKFVDALRAVAAEMSLEELHEQRVEFVQKVQKAVFEDLIKNGLELESVSLTSLDQTLQEYFNPQNAFDAEGLTKLTEEIESRRVERNNIEQNATVAVEKKNLEAEKEKLHIAREKEYASLAQKREVEVRLAEENAEIASQQAQKRRLSEEAEIIAKQEVELTNIKANRSIEEQRIEKEKLVKEKDIESKKAIESAEIEREKFVKLADQDRQIAIAEKSKAQSTMQAEAENARAKAVKAEEEVNTVRENVIAQRQKQIELIETEKEAEQAALRITIAAETEKNAAKDRAEAIQIDATAQAEKERIIAKGKADSETLMIEVAKKRYQVEADGTSALHESENVLSNDIVDMKIKLAIIENLAEIIGNSVKPLESIDGIKIIQVDGLHGNGNGANNSATRAAESSLADQMVNSALKYRGQAPLVDFLLNEIGLSGNNLQNLTKVLNEKKEISEPAKQEKKELPVKQEKKLPQQVEQEKVVSVPQVEEKVAKKPEKKATKKGKGKQK